MIPGVSGICQQGIDASVPIVETCLVRRAANQSLVSTNLISWDTEVFDVGEWFTAPSDSLVVPSGLNISRVRLIGNLSLSADVRQFMLKNGAGFSGRSFLGQGATAGADHSNDLTGILEISEGDAFTIQSQGTTTLNGGQLSWLSIEAIDPAIDYVLCGRATNQGLPSSVTTNINWNTEIFKSVVAMHNNAVNPERLVTPAGATLARVSSGMATDVQNTQGVISCTKNGASFRGAFICDKEVAGSGNSLQISAASAIVAVTGGADYFSTAFFAGLTPNVLANSNTWGCLETFPADHKYAVVYLGGTQAIATGVAEPLEFNAELADAYGFHDPAQPTRLTPPSGEGFTQVRVSGNVVFGSFTGQCIVEVRRTRGGTTTVVAGCPFKDNETAGTDNLNIFGAWMEHQDGDYYELWVTGTTQTLADADGTWFCLEAR